MEDDMDWDNKYCGKCKTKTKWIKSGRTTTFGHMEQPIMICSNNHDYERLVITFNESLSDSSIELIKKILAESLGYKTEIKRL